MTAQTIRIAINAEMDIARAILHAGRLCEQMGLDRNEQSRIATAVSELARNIVKYAGTGHVVLGSIERPGRRGIEIVAEDRGPGIADVDGALREHFSTGGTLGLGLPGVRRLMDELVVESEPGTGTRVTARRWQ